MNARLLIFAACLSSVPLTEPLAQPVPVYSVDYDIHYRGRRAGSSQFSVSRGASPGEYRFYSNSELRGFIARIVAPNPVIEDSVFKLKNGRIVPVTFSYEDGSRKGDDNYSISFDWPASAELTIGGAKREIRLEPGVLDRGSAQVALILGVASGMPADSVGIIDDDGLEPYIISALDPAPTSTEAGEFQTVRFSQQRVGSSRTAVFWFAPELSFVPVRIEQIRNGEVETVFIATDIDIKRD